MNILNIFPWYALVVLLIIEVLIVIKAYNCDEYICSFIFALVMTFYPLIFIKIGWNNLNSIDTEALLQNYTFLKIIIQFIIQYIIAVICFKISNSKISGTSGIGIYVIIFIIVNSIIVEIFQSILKI